MIEIDLPAGWKPFSVSQVKAMALHIFFPNRCMFCRKIIEYNGSLCEECVSSLPESPNPLQLEDITVYSPFVYGLGAENAVQDLKFNANWTNVRKLSGYMAKTILEAECDIDVVIPIPLHKKDLRNREFNQSALLADEIGSLISLPVNAQLLIKTRRTQKQHDLGKAERLVNLDGAFEIDKDNVSVLVGKHILLIDDVCTTGTTFTRCAQILKNAGAISVTGLSAAMVL